MNTLVQAGLNNAISASFLALLVACLGRLLTRRPAVLHCLWFLVLLKLVSPPIYEVSIPWITPSQTAADSDRSRVARSEVAALVTADEFPLESIAIETETSAITWPGTWSLTTWYRAVGWIWLGGIFVTLVLSAWRIRQFHLLLLRGQAGVGTNPGPGRRPCGRSRNRPVSRPVVDSGKTITHVVGSGTIASPHHPDRTLEKPRRTPAHDAARPRAGTPAAG